MRGAYNLCEQFNLNLVGIFNFQFNCGYVRLFVSFPEGFFQQKNDVTKYHLVNSCLGSSFRKLLAGPIKLVTPD